MTPYQQDLVESHLDNARTAAIHVAKSLPPFVEWDDIVSQAYLGLTQAALRYRPESNVPFWAFAQRRVKGAIFDSLRRKNFVHSSTLQLSEHPEAAEGLQAIDETELTIAQREVAREVRRVVATLPAEARTVIELRYARGYNGRDTGRELGVGESQSSQLHHRALDALANSSHGEHLKGLLMKNASKAVVQIDAARRAAVIDELGEVEKRLESKKPDERRKKELVKEILSWVPKTLAAAEETVFHGKKYDARITAQENERTITSMEKVAELLGIKAFIQHAKVTLKQLEVLLSPAQQGQVISSDRTGPRSVDVELREAGQQQKKAA